MARLTEAERAAKREQLRVSLARLTRDGFGRFVRIENLRTCDGGDCGLEHAADWPRKFQSIDAALETVQELVESDDPEVRAIGVEVFLAFRQTMRDDAAEIEEREAAGDRSLLREEFERHMASTPAWVESREIEAVDLTGLDARDAQRLALKLTTWNPAASKVYKWRDGRRYLHPGVVRLNLNDETIRDLGLDADVWRVVHELHIPVQYGGGHPVRLPKAKGLPKAAKAAPPPPDPEPAPAEPPVRREDMLKVVSEGTKTPPKVHLSIDANDKTYAIKDTLRRLKFRYTSGWRNQKGSWDKSYTGKPDEINENANADLQAIRAVVPVWLVRI